MVRDDHVIREREAQEPAQKNKIAQYFKTSGDYVREAFLEEREKAAPEVAQEKKEQALENKKASQLWKKMPVTPQLDLEEYIER
jgi:hypothetical protein